MCSHLFCDWFYREGSPRGAWLDALSFVWPISTEDSSAPKENNSWSANSVASGKILSKIIDLPVGIKIEKHQLIARWKTNCTALSKTQTPNNAAFMPFLCCFVVCQQLCSCDMISEHNFSTVCSRDFKGFQTMNETNGLWQGTSSKNISVDNKWFMNCQEVLLLSSLKFPDVFANMSSILLDLFYLFSCYFLFIYFFLSLFHFFFCLFE